MIQPAERTKTRLIKALIITVIALLSLSLRLYSLNSDPPDFLSWSAAIYIDEGYKALDARNTLKYGSSKWSEHDTYRGHRDESKVIHEIQMWIFKQFGIKIINLRYFNVAVSVGIIVCVMVTLAFAFEPLFLLLIGISMSINVIFLFHSKIALYEMPMVFTGSVLIPFIVLFFTPHVLHKREQKIVIGCILALMFAGLTYLGMRIKGSHAIYMGSIAVSFAIAASLPLYGRKIKLPRFLEAKNLFKLAIAAILFVSVVLYTWQANLGYQVRYLGNPLMVLGKIWFMEIIYLQPNIFVMSVLCTIAILLIIFNRRFVNYTRENLYVYQIDLFFALQFVLSFLVVYMSSYSPLRYFLFSEVSILYLAGRFVANYDHELRILKTRKMSVNRYIRNPLVFLIFFYLVVQFIIFLIMLFMKYEARKVIFDDFYLNLAKGNINNSHAYFVMVIILVVLPGVYYFTVNHRDIIAFLKKHLSRKIMVFLLIEIQLIYLLSWQFNKTNNLRECMDFVRTLPPGRVIIGDWAPMLAFESDLKIIYSDFKDNRNIDNIPLLRPDYVVIKANMGEEELYNQKVPGLIKPEHLVYRFKVQAHDIRIYRVDLYNGGRE